MAHVIATEVAANPLVASATEPRYQHRGWTRETIASGGYPVFYDLTETTRDQIAQAVPYRLIETTRYFLPHTDNAMLEPRWPDYLGLLCLTSAKSGGENLVTSAYTLLREIASSHPDYVGRLNRPWHIDPPLEQRLPGGSPTWSKPIFEIIRDELKVHYLRYYIDPGMQKAGCPMSDEETAILDHLDSLLERPELAFTHKLEPGEILFNNNNWTLHGRKAFVDHPEPERKRLLMRIWLWRRHVWPGIDPADLDAAELDLER